MPQHQQHFFIIAQKLDRLVRQVNVDLLATGDGGWPNTLDRIANEILYDDLIGGNLGFTGVEMLQANHIVDDIFDPLRAIHHTLEIQAVLIHALVAHHHGVAQHNRKRRAQLVRSNRNKLAFQPIQFLNALVGLAQLAIQRGITQRCAGVVCQQRDAFLHAWPKRAWPIIA